MPFITDLISKVTNLRIKIGDKLNILKSQIGQLNSLTTDDKTSLVGAVNEVNNIQIGGRNLIIGLSKHFETSNGWYYYSLSERLIEGESYYISGDINNPNGSVLAVGLNLNNGINNNLISLPLNQSFIATVQMSWLDKFCLAVQTENGIVKFSNFKLEKGNKATDWTPAPDDQVSNWAETNSNSLSFIKGKEIVNNEFNNIYDQISSRANNRLSNLASDLTVDEKRVIQDKTGAVSKTGDNVVPNSKWDNYSKGIYGYLDTDFWRIQGNLVSPNNVELELATADDATEAIVVRQYGGEFTSRVREAYLLDANGNTSFPGTVTATSFYESSLRKYKKNIKEYSNSALDIVKSLDVVTYDRTDSYISNKIGIIADDSHEDVLNEEKTAVDLYKTIFVLTKAVQELSEKVEKLESKIV